MTTQPSTILALLLSVIALALPFGDKATAGEQAGKMIYEEGRLPDGSPVRAQLLGGEIQGRRAACATCHRRSGYGTSEGELDVPSVTGALLFAPLDERRVDLMSALYETPLSRTALAKARMPRLRPAYDHETLAQAITTGVDASGRRLHGGMPRYQLNGDALNSLITFLDGLGRDPASGVSTSNIHFATVIAGDVSPKREAALKAVIDAFVARHNFDQEALNANHGRFPHRKDLYIDSRRKWRVHIWRLKGPPEDWHAALTEHYKKQPVFALLGGMAEGAWAPVDRFCEINEIPCLFPDTIRPAASKFWTAYLSEGLLLEARTLAFWLSEHPTLLGEDPVFQVIGTSDDASAVARMFSAAVAKSPGVDVQSFLLGSLPDQCPGTALFWVSREEVTELGRFRERCGEKTRVIVSGGLLGEAEARRLRNTKPAIGMTYPFALDQRNNPDSVRHRAWLRSRGIGGIDASAAARTYFALDAARNALRRIVDRFSHAYFLESVEHAAENLSNPGLFDHISLGAGQRFALKGVYVFPPDDLDSEGEWLVQ